MPEFCGRLLWMAPNVLYVLVSALIAVPLQHSWIRYYVVVVIVVVCVSVNVRSLLSNVILID